MGFFTSRKEVELEECAFRINTILLRITKLSENIESGNNINKQIDELTKLFIFIKQEVELMFAKVVAFEGSIDNVTVADASGNKIPVAYYMDRLIFVTSEMCEEAGLGKLKV